MHYRLLGLDVEGNEYPIPGVYSDLAKVMEVRDLTNEALALNPFSSRWVVVVSSSPVSSSPVSVAQTAQIKRQARRLG